MGWAKGVKLDGIRLDVLASQFRRANHPAPHLTAWMTGRISFDPPEFSRQRLGVIPFGRHGFAGRRDHRQFIGDLVQPVPDTILTDVHADKMYGKRQSSTISSGFPNRAGLG
jgi:hypothetical protein